MDLAKAEKMIALQFGACRRNHNKVWNIDCPFEDAAKALEDAPLIDSSELDQSIEALKEIV